GREFMLRQASKLLLCGAAAAWASCVLVGAAAGTGSSSIVISQVYGGGGNSGATYLNDYVELFNRGSSAVSLAGWSIQYASATGTGNFGNATNVITPLSGTLAPGKYLLVQEASGGGHGAAPPTADVTDSTPINMSASDGKVALTDTTSSLGCNGGSTPCPASALAHIIDLVGYGGANFFEGSAAAPGLSSSRADFRANGGCVDNDDNAADFAVAPPAPRNGATDAHACDADTAPSVTSTIPANGANGIALGSNVSITFSEPVNVTGAWYSLSCSSSGAHTATVSGGPTTFTLDPD